MTFQCKQIISFKPFLLMSQMDNIQMFRNFFLSKCLHPPSIINKFVWIRGLACCLLVSAYRVWAPGLGTYWRRAAPVEYSYMRLLIRIDSVMNRYRRYFSGIHVYKYGSKSFCYFAYPLKVK